MSYYLKKKRKGQMHKGKDAERGEGNAAGRRGGAPLGRGNSFSSSMLHTSHIANQDKGEG